MQVDKYQLLQDSVCEYMLPAGATPLTITPPTEQGYAGTLWYSDPMHEHGDPVELRVYRLRGSGWVEGEPEFAAAFLDEFATPVVFFWKVIS